MTKQKTKTSIPIYTPWITDLEKEYANKALSSGWISSKGEFIEQFEDLFAKYIGVKYAVSVCNGSAACHLCLVASDIGQAEVLCPTLTFVATANAIANSNNKPVFMDSNVLTWNCDTPVNEELINQDVKAIFAVHLLGNPVNYLYLKDLCKRYNLILIEDACESLGAYYKSGPTAKKKMTGSWGLCSAFSFWGNKSLTIGCGGMLCTDDENVYQQAKLYRDSGTPDKKNPYDHTVIGFNYSLSNIHAAIGVAQMIRIEEIQQQKKRVWDRYWAKLKDGMQFTPKNHVHSHWMIAVLVNDYAKAKKALAKNGVDSRPMFTRMSQLTPYRYCAKTKDDQISEYLEKQVLMLPSYPELPDFEIDRICDIVKPYLEENL